MQFFGWQSFAHPFIILRMFKCVLCSLVFTSFDLSFSIFSKLHSLTLTCVSNIAWSLHSFFCFVYFCVFSTHKLLYTNNIWKICKKSIDGKSHTHLYAQREGERKYNKTRSLFRMRACFNAHTNIVVRNFGILNQALRYRKKNATTRITKIKATWLAWFGLELELLNHHDSGHFKFTSQISTAGDFQIIYLYRLLANYIKLERSSIERAFLRALFFSTKIKLCIYCWIACRSLCMPALNWLWIN